MSKQNIKQLKQYLEKQAEGGLFDLGESPIVKGLKSLKDAVTDKRSLLMQDTATGKPSDLTSVDLEKGIKKLVADSLSGKGSQGIPGKATGSRLGIIPSKPVVDTSETGINLPQTATAEEVLQSVSESIKNLIQGASEVTPGGQPVPEQSISLPAPTKKEMAQARTARRKRMGLPEKSDKGSMTDMFQNIDWQELARNPYVIEALLAGAGGLGYGGYKMFSDDEEEAGGLAPKTASDNRKQLKKYLETRADIRC
jgi:hypothetical protein